MVSVWQLDGEQSEFSSIKSKDMDEILLVCAVKSMPACKRRGWKEMCCR